MTLEEAIEHFRAEESIESVLILLGSDEFSESLRRVALVWKNQIPTIPEGLDFEFDDELWGNLWASAKYKVEPIAKISGTGADCKALINTLIGYRLIYPDGTLASVAKKALLTMAKTQLGL